jgi:hypothetical protein
MPSGALQGEPRAFYVTREPFSDFFVIHVPKPDGTIETEELEVEDTYEWFKKRGADMPLLEKGLDHIWNFAKGMIEIARYKEPIVQNPALEPRL